ncbi:NAD kinase 2, chloroplastic isoform X2 [Cornus florida]|uniref:NAD kinase 2, chloroplastic isoform X2 n=1 Tax=Cornus florida TaxID=4283 RepID=UPI00289A79C6|nr:NAD kinase 2, chloroplastic isoform X2 [Cornus florida]
MAYCCSCHLFTADMTQSFAAGATRLCSLKSHQFRNTKISGFKFEFLLQKKVRLSERRRLISIVSAELSSSVSANISLDSQSRDLSKLPWIGPLPGDIAEVEGYCRIFRAAERLHNALMETLCNPLTGECSVSYSFQSEDKPLLEDKVVSVLGCMVCLLNKGREDVLSGRSSIINSFRASDLNVIDDKLPPLAIFRGEMKRYCESLHVALENYLTPDDIRSSDVWTKLQRLKNICYDSGFPRGDGYPCHSLFANWNPVYISTVKDDIEPTDSETAFWKGGQVTEEGMQWLIEKGFKTIVDLRAEIVNDIFYQLALDDAILSGKVELVKLPVEVGTVPSMEQVEKFSAIVSDSTKKPVYLHSKEGMQRTFAMVSRWRQYMARYASQLISNHSVTASDIPSRDKRRMEELHIPSNFGEDKAFDNGNGLLQEKSDAAHSAKVQFLNQVSPATENKSQSSNGAYNGIVSHKGSTSRQTFDGNAVESLLDFCFELNPLESQLPPCDLFSRKEMSRFFRNKKISPPTYINYQWKRLETISESRDNCYGEVQRSGITETNPESRLMETRSSNGSPNGKNLSLEPHSPPASNGTYLGRNGYVPSLRTSNGLVTRESHAMSKMDDPTSTTIELNNNFISKTITEDKRNNIEGSTALDDDELGIIEGNMCASATGVVRVQSRKKAQMFLVRTDGISCTREKVTESSLAFTHPSTQQQMLMWKTTPRTVLLLKKLGQELMEEAKEVASFLYHQEKMNVLVEPEVHDIFARIPGFGFVQTFYSQDTSDLHERVDFVACLGGDGVILHASNLFRGAVPPVVSFNLGSLGFLTSHTFEGYRQDLRQVIHGNNTADGVYITLRMRLRCEIFRNGKAMPGKVFDILNEVVVDRGSNPYLSKIECYEHDRLITKVQGDGVIVATPTGSTAYSTAAGGSMVHPNVPCMLFTPICPHSLSFRPVILPDSARLELKIPENARSNAWVSFDGKRRQQLSRGDSVRICMSQHPLPTVNKSDQTGDWFHSLIRCLNWNERLDQKAL